MRFLMTAVAMVLMTCTASAASTDVDLVAGDGTVLKATYKSPGKPGPGMLLIHQCNQTRGMWDFLADQLVDAGVHVMTLDLRGFGESQGKGIREAGGFPAFLATATGDVALAFNHLTEQSGVDGARLGAGGASCGAMLTADLAAANPSIATLMLLSGPPSDNAVSHMATRADLAVFAAAATDDPITPGVAERLQAAVDGSAHPDSKAMIYGGPEHGLPMFATNADLEPALVGWLKGSLGVE